MKPVLGCGSFVAGWSDGKGTAKQSPVVGDGKGKQRDAIVL